MLLVTSSRTYTFLSPVTFLLKALPGSLCRKLVYLYKVVVFLEGPLIFLYLLPAPISYKVSAMTSRS